jgi:hypothetical protein
MGKKGGWPVVFGKLALLTGIPHVTVTAATDITSLCLTGASTQGS